MVQFKDPANRFRTEQYCRLTDSQWQDICKFLETGRKRQYSLRFIFDAIRKVIRTGDQWRNVFALNEREGLPSWQLLFYYFRKWQKSGILDIILAHLVAKERKRQGKDTQASVSAVDSQSVKKGSFVCLETGIDGGKLVNGRKRHLAVDTLGLPLAIHVSAANKADGKEGFELLWRLDKASEKLHLIRGDSSYGGEFKDAARFYNWTVDTTQRPPSEKGFIPQAGRWQVERSFSWFNFFRRLAKDFEKTTESAVATMQIAFMDIILARF